MVIGEHRVGPDDLRAVRAALIAEEACVLLDEAAAIAAVAQLDPGPGGGEGGAAVPGLDDLGDGARAPGAAGVLADADGGAEDVAVLVVGAVGRSEEHTSELQSRGHLVCRLLL